MPGSESTEDLSHGVIRTLTPCDNNAVIALHLGLDQSDSYLRFFMPRPKDLTATAAMITAQDAHHGAVGAFIGVRLVGVANFVVQGETRSAEIALVVAHDEQLHGVGTRLLRRLRLLALEHRVEIFIADVLAENSRMLQLFADIGWPTSRRQESGAIHFEIDLCKGETPNASVLFAHNQ
jgi:GNAT superfamily N-acetyltransferase